MKQFEFMTAGDSQALQYASQALAQKGWIKRDHARIVLLPVPSLGPDGSINGGGAISDLPANALIIGGNLQGAQLEGRHRIDLLKNALYLSENAAITAHCALKLATELLPVILHGCPVLVFGWGRIGKCLVRLLRLLGADVTVAARSEADRALIAALGYRVMDPAADKFDLTAYRIIYNTVPAMVLPLAKQDGCREDCVKIDLASVPGIEGDGVIWARGLPNKDAPESSGRLIAQIVEKELHL